MSNNPKPTYFNLKIKKMGVEVERFGTRRSSEPDGEW